MTGTLDLKRWYSDQPHFVAVSYITGTGEIALVDDTHRVRIYSGVTQQFRLVQ
jgi:hypothetical protein